MENEPIEVTLKVTYVLEELGIEYLIGGSLASALYGIIRATHDSDIVAEMKIEYISPFISALKDEFFIDDEMIAESIQRHSSFNIIHRETMFKVDVFVPAPSRFLRSQLTRARKQNFLLKEEVSAKFASPEDTILSKLEWYRMGGEGSDHQWRDILGVLKICAGDLDLDYLREWASELNVSDLFERAYRDAS